MVTVVQTVITDNKVFVSIGSYWLRKKHIAPMGFEPMTCGKCARYSDLWAKTLITFKRSKKKEAVVNRQMSTTKTKGRGFDSRQRPQLLSSSEAWTINCGCCIPFFFKNFSNQPLYLTTESFTKMTPEDFRDAALSGFALAIGMFVAFGIALVTSTAAVEIYERASRKLRWWMD